jgi:hypothetical protein
LAWYRKPAAPLWIPEIVFRQVARQIPDIMKHANYLDHFLLPALDQKMPGLPDDPQRGARSISAEKQVICPNAPGQVRALLRSGPVRIVTDIANSLLE